MLPISVAKGTVTIDQSLISIRSHKKVSLSQGLMLSSNICLKEWYFTGTAHLKGVFCVLLLLKGMLLPVVSLVLLFTLELQCVLFENCKRMG